MYKKFRKGVFVIVYSSKPLCYLLLRRKRHWKGWEFTKGGRKAKEKPLNTVKRELKEETGLNAIKATRFKIRGKFIYDKKTQREWKAKGFSYELFAAEVKKGKVKINKREHDSFRWCKYNEAMKLLRWPNQRNALKIVNKFIIRFKNT